MSKRLHPLTWVDTDHSSSRTPNGCPAPSAAAEEAAATPHQLCPENWVRILSILTRFGVRGCVDCGPVTWPSIELVP
jgi:hypothetical protein